MERAFILYESFTTYLAKKLSLAAPELYDFLFYTGLLGSIVVVFAFIFLCIKKRRRGLANIVPFYIAAVLLFKMMVFSLTYSQYYMVNPENVSNIIFSSLSLAQVSVGLWLIFCLNKVPKLWITADVLLYIAWFWPLTIFSDNLTDYYEMRIRYTGYTILIFCINMIYFLSLALYYRRKTPVKNNSSSP